MTRRPQSRSTRLLCLTVLSLSGLAACDAVDDLLGPDDPELLGPSATISAPVSGGNRNQAFGTTPLPATYIEEERFLSGTAASFTRVGTWGVDGRWEVAPADSAAYTIRMLVRRPANPRDFNGMVVVEWLNVTALAEGAADYSQMEEELLREGYVWVGVGAQAIGVNAPGVGLKAWDPVRYGPLSHPGDRFSYDIFSQVARAVGNVDNNAHPLHRLRVQHVLATGRSQSAFRLVTYLNAFHLKDQAFDGYFVHSRGATAAGLRSESLAADAPAIPRGAKIRDDIDVPVFDIQAEGDMITLGAHLTRQPASALYRRWELAGVAHAEIPLWVADSGRPPSLGPGCAIPVNSAPHHAFVKAGLRALTEWVRDGSVPTQSPEIELGAPTATNPAVVRDEYGNARGGVRIPQVAAPTAAIDGVANTVGSSAPGGQNFCFLFGRTRLLDDATLRRLYPTHDAFVDRYITATDALVRDRYLLDPEAEQARNAARNSRVGH